MAKTIFAIVVLLLVASACPAQSPPEMPQPTKDHEWLRKLVGEWESEGEAVFEPGQAPVKCRGTEIVRSIGGFWVLAESRGTIPGTDMPMTGLLTLGYDPEKKNYIGTWVDSGTSHLWKYEGTLDATGKILTLETEGPSFFDPKQMAKYREVIELKSDDHKVFKSSVQYGDGLWHTFVTFNHRRKGAENSDAPK